jgi:hypothetical protein
MTLTLVIVSSLSAAVGSLCTGYLLKLIEHRREARDATQLEVARRRAVARFEAVRAIHGSARELYHAINGVVRYAGEEPFYNEQVIRLCRELRQSARAEVEVLGEPYVEGVHALTDAAIKVLDYSGYSSRGSFGPVPYFFEDTWMSFLARSIDVSGQKKKKKKPDVSQDLPPSLEAEARRPEQRQEQKPDVSQDLPLSLEAKMRKPEP